MLHVEDSMISFDCDIMVCELHLLYEAHKMITKQYCIIDFYPRLALATSFVLSMFSLGSCSLLIEGGYYIIW